MTVKSTDNDIKQDDAYWMRYAMALAAKAEALGEVPVGAVIVRDNEVIGEGFNQPISSHDPTAHAEVVALRHAAQHLENYRVVDATLYVTLEPCSMCVGALTHGRVARLVYGTKEPKAGAVVSAVSLVNAEWFNHKIDVQGGVLADECSEQLSQFFRSRRAAKKNNK